MNEIKKQCNALKAALSNALDRIETEEIDSLYLSKFGLTFTDAKTGKTTKIELFVCPETVEIFERLSDEIPEILEDYN